MKTNLKIDNDSTFAHHEACPQCNSKDNLARYTDGHAYCFGHNCGYYEPPSDIIKPIQMTNKPKNTEFIESDKTLWYKTRRFAAMVQQNNYSTHVSQLLDLGAG